MSQNVSFAGTSYPIPNTAGENGWANLTNYLVAIATYAQTTVNQKVAVRTATSSPVTVASTDYAVYSNLSVAGAVTMTLPTGTTGVAYVLGDAKGDAATNNVTIQGTGGQTINGSSTYVIKQNYGAIAVVFDGTGWRVMAEFIATTVLATRGGTGFASYTVGDMLYASSTTALSKLAIGTANYVLSSTGSAPQWGLIVNANVDAAAAIARTKIASGTASHVIINDGSGVLSSEATLAVSRGGTNLASYTTGDIVYASGATTLAKLGIGTASQVLQVNAGATAPEWSSAINGVSIGGTTPAAGAFTTLSSTGATALCSSSGALTVGASTPGAIGHAFRGITLSLTTASTTSEAECSFNVTNTNTSNATFASLLVSAGSGPQRAYLRAVQAATPESQLGVYANKMRFTVGSSLTPTYMGDFDSAGWTLATALTLSFLSTAGPVLTNGSGVISSEATLAVARGGTNIASYTAGDTLYASGATTLTKLAIGTANYVLRSTGSAPAWALLDNNSIDAAAAIARSKLASGTASHVIVNDGSGVMTSEAQLNVVRGGTGRASLTAGALFYGAGTSAVEFVTIGTARQLLQVNAGASAPEWTSAINPTSVGATSAGTGAFTTLSATGIVTFSGNPMARAVKGSDSASFTSGNTVHVYFGTQVSDIGGDNYAPGSADHESATTNGSSYTVPASAGGTYVINSKVWFQRDTGGQFLTQVQVEITVNGTRVSVISQVLTGTAEASQSLEINTGPIVLAAADVVKVLALATTTASTWSINGSTGRTQFSIAKVA